MGIALHSFLISPLVLFLELPETANGLRAAARSLTAAAASDLQFAYPEVGAQFELKFFKFAIPIFQFPMRAKRDGS